MKKFEVTNSFCIMLFLALFLTPLSLLLCILAAAAIHETGHLLSLSHFGVAVERVRLTAEGAIISAPEVKRLSYGKELVVTLGGIGANILAAMFSAAVAEKYGLAHAYVFAGANAVLAAYNLLPVLPLDGGRALYLVTAYFFGPMVGDEVTAVTGLLVSAAIVYFGIRVSLTLGGGYFFLLAALFIFLGAIRQLALAKGAVKV